MTEHDYTRFGELIAMREHLMTHLDVMGISFEPRHRMSDDALRGWSHARAVNACRLLNVEDELIELWNGPVENMR